MIVRQHENEQHYQTKQIHLPIHPPCPADNIANETISDQIKLLNGLREDGATSITNPNKLNKVLHYFHKEMITKHVH